MDKTMEIVVVLMVLMLAAVIVVVLLTDQAGMFGGFSDNQTGDARCSLWEQQYERRYCEDGTDTRQGQTDLSQNLEDSCEGVPSC